MHAAVAAFADIAQYAIDMDRLGFGAFCSYCPSKAMASQENLRLSAERVRENHGLCFAADSKNSPIEAYARRLARLFV